MHLFTKCALVMGWRREGQGKGARRGRKENRGESLMNACEHLSQILQRAVNTVQSYMSLFEEVRCPHRGLKNKSIKFNKNEKERRSGK
jgi:hypothetical protein